MDPQTKLPLQDLNRIQLRDLVDGIAEDYRDVLKIRVKSSGVRGLFDEIGVRRQSSAGFFDVDTGAVAVVEHRTGGVATRQIIMLNNGFRSEKSVPVKVVPPNVTEVPRDFIQQGPFRDPQKITYIKHGDVRIEYKGEQVTRIVGPDEVEIPRAKFGDVKIFPNEHHAEMRILQWAERNNYRIVALAPTRGCCPHCALRMQQYFIKQNVNIDDAIPKARQTRSLWRSFLKDLRAAQARAPGEFTVKGARLDVSALRAQVKARMTAFRAPDPRLLRISRFLKVAGPAMLAFDAATSCARAADQWDKGNRDAAAETLSEFGGRAAGAFVGAEACALALGGFGSVIPGLGTTVGALAGIVIGGAVGAYLGEKGARQLCDQVIAWTRGGQPPAQKALSQASKPRATNPDVAKLQNEMQSAGYGAPEIAAIGRLFESPLLEGKAPKAAFEQIGSELVPFGATTDEDAWLTQYPAGGEPDHSVTAMSVAQLHPPASPATTPATTPIGTARQPVQPLPDTRGEAPPAPHVVKTVHAELITPQPQAPVEPWTAPESPIRREPEHARITDLSERVDSLRCRLADYDALAAGRPALVPRDQFEADLNELRAIQDQLTLRGASPLEAQALQVKLNEVRNRYDQIDGDARSAEDRKAEILRKQQEGERWRADQAARDARPAEQAYEPARAQRPEDHDLRALEERERRDIERERRAEQDRADERKRRERDDDARDREAREEREAKWQAEDDRKREETRRREDDDRRAGEILRQQETDASDRAAKTQGDERRRDEDRLMRNEKDAQRLAADVRLRADEAARRLEDERLVQDEKDARRRADDARHQADDDARRRDDERRSQDERESQLRADETRRVENEQTRRADDLCQQGENRQREDQRRRDKTSAPSAEPTPRTEPDDRREVDDRRDVEDARRRDDERRSQDERESQLRADETRRVENEQTRRADDLRQQDENRQREDQRRRDMTSAPSAEPTPRTEPDDRRAVDDRRDLEDARRRADDERRPEEQRLAEEAFRADRARQRDGETRDSRRLPESDAPSKDSHPPQDDDRQQRSTRDEAERQRADEQRREHEEARRAEETRRQQEEQQRRAEEEWGRRKEEEQQRRAAEEWRRQQEEQQRRAEEESRRQQEEAERRRREEEEESRKQVSVKILWPDRDP